MEILADITPIIKQYFNSAVIIDDELNPYPSYEDEKISLNDDDIDFSDFEGLDESIESHSAKEVAASSVISSPNLTDTPFSANDVFFEFIDEGFVTLPIRFSNNFNEGKYLDAVKNAKLLILDWNLDDSTPDFMGESAIKILNKYLETDIGLKCAIIYTRENLMDVQQKIDPLYPCTNYSEDVIYFEKKTANFDSSFLGFILDKKINPKMILDTISNILFEQKGLTLHLLESANFINSHLNKAVEQFNAPFEKVLSTQLITSEISDNKVTKFINEKLLSNILEYQYLEKRDHPLNFLYLNKKQKLMNKLKSGIKEDDISSIIDLLKIKGKKDETKITSLFTEDKQNVIDILKKSSTLDIFVQQINLLIIKKYNLKDEKSSKKIVNHFLLTLISLEDFKNKVEFQKSFYEQTVTFTKITKFLNINEDIQTGSVLNDIKNPNIFLLCITPVCDIARISDINNKYKFIVGEIVEEVKDSDLKNSNEKHYYMGLPIENKLCFIKWKFYETTTVDTDDIKKYANLNLLKTEYTQLIINRYIAYQSRAGIDEIYYKESNYINNFIDIIKNP